MSTTSCYLLLAAHYICIGGVYIAIALSHRS